MFQTYVGADHSIRRDSVPTGSLSTGEFATTLRAGLSTNAAQRKFRAADRNVNGTVQLNEFLIFTGTISAPSKAEEQFSQLDVNSNASISYGEFTASAKVRASQPRTTTMTACSPAPSGIPACAVS